MYRYIFLYRLPAENHTHGKRNLSFKIDAVIDQNGYIKCKYPQHRFIKNEELMYRDIQMKLDRLIDGELILSYVDFDEEPGNQEVDQLH